MFYGLSVMKGDLMLSSHMSENSGMFFCIRYLFVCVKLVYTVHSMAFSGCLILDQFDQLIIVHGFINID